MLVIKNIIVIGITIVIKFMVVDVIIIKESVEVK